MHGAVTIHMEAPAMEIWALVADVRNTARFSPETLDAEWLDGVTEPAVGGCPVPRSCQTQRDRAGLLDDVPGDGLRTGS